MFLIQNNTIHLTRGNIANIEIGAYNEDGSNYIFQTGDVVRFKAFKRKDCEKVELEKDVVIDEPTISVNISLSGEDTKLGELINKPTIYWYEVELNPETAPQTIIGYDLEGEKQLILYPEGGE